MTALSAPRQLQQASVQSGSLRLAGRENPIPLTGSYDDSTRQLSVSGDGFVFAGVITADGSELSDSYNGLAGAFGGFTMLNATNMLVTPYCGTYAGQSESLSKEGVWNMVISATGQVAGMYVNSQSLSSGRMTGRLTGASLEITADGGVTASATLTADSLRGTWRDSAVTGTFAGSTGGCQ